MFTYRLATSADLDHLAELNEQLIQDEGHRNRMNREQLRTRMAQWLATGYCAILFERDDQIVAYALYRSDPDSIYIRHFFVTREQRRLGVGRMAAGILLTAVLPRNQAIQLEVLVTNERARAFWQALGFEPYALTMERPTRQA